MNIIARHFTTEGQSIAIIGNPGEFLQIVRIGEDGAFVSFDRVRGEIAARKIANTLWLRDMGRAPKMIVREAPMATVIPREDHMSDRMRKVIGVCG